jgi:ribosomal protein S20
MKWLRSAWRFAMSKGWTPTSRWRRQGHLGWESRGQVWGIVGGSIGTPLLPCASVPSPLVAAIQLITRSREVRPLAKTPRTWTGARTPSGLKRVRQAERRREILQPRRTAAKTFVAKALDVATHQTDSETAQTALAEAHAALDRAAKAGAIHANAAARRKSRLTLKFNAATGGAFVQTSTRITKTTSKAQAVKAAKSRIAASKADKAKGAQTAAGKARAALSKTARADAAAKAAASAAPPTAKAPTKAAGTKSATTKASTAKPAAKSTATKAKATAAKPKAAAKAPAKKTAAK